MKDNAEARALREQIATLEARLAKTTQDLELSHLTAALKSHVAPGLVRGAALLLRQNQHVSRDDAGNITFTLDGRSYDVEAGVTAWAATDAAKVFLPQENGSREGGDSAKFARNRAAGLAALRSSDPNGGGDVFSKLHGSAR